MKKIAIIIERTDVNLGGAERSVSELAQALCEHDCQVEIIAAKGRSDNQNVRFLCSDLPGKRTGFNDFENALTDLVQEGTIEILTYAWRMSDDLEREKRFIYTPSHGDPQ